jgi:hypothetical protein
MPTDEPKYYKKINIENNDTKILRNVKNIQDPS